MRYNRDEYKPTPIIKLIVQFDKCAIYSDLVVFKDYIYDNKLSIKDFQNEFNKRTTDIEFIDKEEQKRFEIYLEQESNKYFDSYPRLFRNSFFVTLYSYFESKLKKLHDDLSKYDKKNLNAKLKGDGSIIDKYKDFLQTNYNTDFSSIKADWIRMQNYGHIRNAITHYNSNIKNGKKSITFYLEILKGFESIKLEEDTGDFFIENELFILNFLNTIEHCLVAIYSEIENKI